MDYLFTADALIGLTTLTFMEIVLGIDNIVYIAIVAGKVAPDQQKRARNLGLILAVIPRVILLFFISWLLHLEDKLVDITLWGNNIYMTEKGFVLLAGGVFLLYKATTEIHTKLEGLEEEAHHGHKSSHTVRKYLSLPNALIQIIILNIVFSLDSVLSAVSLTNLIEIMIAAIVLSMLITLAFARIVTDFVENNPTVKMLALSFLLLIGFLLVTESFVVNHKHVEIPKGYIYFAMAFSLFVEMLNLRMRKKIEDTDESEETVEQTTTH